jgi:hypothetical protein
MKIVHFAMLFPSFLYNLDRDRERKARDAVMVYRPEHFSLLSHVAVSYRGQTMHKAVQLLPYHTPLAPGTCVASVSMGFEMDADQFVIERLGRVVSSKVKYSVVLWATEYTYDRNTEKAAVVRHDPPRKDDCCANIWLAVLRPSHACDVTDFGPVPPLPPKKRKRVAEEKDVGEKKARK